MKAKGLVRSISASGLAVLLLIASGPTLALDHMGRSLRSTQVHAPAADYALQFDGLDDSVVVSDSLMHYLYFEEAMTLEAWVKPSAFSGSQFRAIVRGTFFEPPTVGGCWSMYQGYADQSNWGQSVCTTNCHAAESGPGGLVAGEWQHIASTYNGTTIQIYKDGQPVATAAHSGNVSGANYLLFGQWEVSFEGLIDEIRVWDVVRTEEEIRRDRHRALTGSEPGLVGYWRFNEGSGQAVVDATGHFADGQLGTSSGSDDQDPLWVASQVPLETWIVYLPLVRRG
jgi:hypothetical protein